MTRSARRLYVATVVLMMLVFAWLLVKRYFIIPDLASHRGDGEFTNISRRMGPFVLRGYSISFPPFSLSQKYHATFQFSSLPNIGVKSSLYLVILDPQALFTPGDGKELDQGELRLRLCDSAGTVLQDSRGRPSDFVWSWLPGIGHALYPIDGSRFQPNTEAEYTLSVWYDPDPRLKSLTAYTYIECGGRP